MLRPAKNARPHNKRRLTSPERLEDRLAMDGAGFVNTDPPEDPDSIVGEAGVTANDDYLEVKAGTQSLRIAPLANDQLPEGAQSLRIKSVSATRVGAMVTVSEDGRHLIYTAGEGGFSEWDSLYYIVETDDGRLGKANVNLGRKHEPSGGSYNPVISGRDNYSVLEDSGEITLNVLSNDHFMLENPVIVSVAAPSRGGTVRISDDGLSLRYEPKHGESGSEYFNYTARGADGEEAVFQVRVSIDKPYQIVSRNDTASLSYGVAATTLNPLANDQLRGPTPQDPQIESFTLPGYAGQLTLAEDGRRLVFVPAEGFQGSVNIQYTVRYGAEDHQTVSNSFGVNVQQHTWAVENWFQVEPGIGGPTPLDVLANDPTFLPWGFNDGQAHYLPPLTGVSRHIVAVSSGSAGGAIAIADDGQTVGYLPAAGFTGDETFTYTIEDSTGLRQTAAATVHVAPMVADPSGVDRFATEGELQQYLIDRAVTRYLGQFGVYQQRYDYGGVNPWGPVYRTNLTFDAGAGDGLGAVSYSETNTQVDGVDEADIVETDGRYVYTLSHGQLVIVDVENPHHPRLASVTSFEGRFDTMYLQGDRLTLIRSGSLYHYAGQENGAEVLVLELGDRTAPSVVERTEIDGYIADSRAIGDRVHLVVKRNFEVPELEGEWVIDPVPPAEEPTAAEGDYAYGAGDVILVDLVQPVVSWGEPGVWRNETLDEYLDRVRDELFDAGLPSYRSYGADGELASSGLLTEPTDLHKAIAGDDLVVSLLTLDAGDAAAGPIADATSFIADDQTTVFMSADAAYLFSYDPANDSTTIHKLAFESDGDAPLVASGLIRGRLLNQFSADEFDGVLRVATTQQERETLPSNRWRQTRLFNNLLVLEQDGAELKVVGQITNLAPTETIHSVRFLGERAYVVTFRRIDPLFAINLSDPTTPTVEGALKIPGFSNYLHPVGEDYLIGVGRDADEITGQLGPLQITLFNVADLSNPVAADQVTFEGADWVNSEAWFDHHAVSFFAESGVLTIPISWSEQRADPEGTGHTYESLGAVFTFKVDTSGEEASIEATGRIEHDPVPATGGWEIYPTRGVIVTDVWAPYPTQTVSLPRRTLRIGESLITVSSDWLEVHDLNKPSEQIGKLFIGPPGRNDHFTIDEDSGANRLEVLENDHPGDSGQAGKIASVTQPSIGGVVTLAPSERELLFTPDEDFFGQVSFTYTIEDPQWGERTATVYVNVSNTPDAPVAVDDQFTIAVDAGPTSLDVLQNDLNPDANPGLFPTPWVLDDVSRTTALAAIDLTIWPGVWGKGLTITSVSSPTSGGELEIDAGSRLLYTPAAGYSGWETFSYTIENFSGLTDTATVSIWVGAERPQRPLRSLVAIAGAANTELTAARPGRPEKALANRPAPPTRPQLLLHQADDQLAQQPTQTAEGAEPAAASPTDAARPMKRQLAFDSVFAGGLGAP